MQSKLRQARKVPVIRSVPRRHQEHDRLGQQPASDKRERLDREAVEPLRVVDDQQHRLLLGQPGQKLQHSEADKETVRRRPNAETERRGEGISLRRG